MKYLTVQDLGLIHLQIIDASGGSQGVRDTGRIESAVASVQQEVFGQELYSAVYEKAAALLRAIIIADHAFVDGNKRTGMMCALIFLNLNGIDTSKLQNKELEDFAVQVVVEHLDIPTITEWLKTHSAKAS